MDADLGMIVYSALLALALVVSSPVWLWRMATSGRYREGLGQRLGVIPAALLRAVDGKRVIWLHAVSVGEALAAARLVKELGAAIGDGWMIVISTTTATGQKLAQQRFGADRVFYYPLDFAWIVRRYLHALKPGLLILMESELWPRMLVECERASIPVAVVNARISDRSFRRSMRMRSGWMWAAGRVDLWLAQGAETAHRLQALGIATERIEATGNLKYDLRPVQQNVTAEWIHALADGRPIVVAGSTLGATGKAALSEDEMLIQAWETAALRGTLLVLAPRHPDRFDEVAATASEFVAIRASTLMSIQGTTLQAAGRVAEIVVLDTLGDLASVYAVATVAFLGGSLVARGGHNPLEAARFGVPVVMGPSYENFREIVEGMKAADAIRIAKTPAELAPMLLESMDTEDETGARGRAFFESQIGATERTVDALLELLP